MKMIKFGWLIFILVNINIFTFGSFLPWLTSSMHDELVLVSIVTIGLLLTINYVSILQLIKMYKELNK